jgi:hypothetical protein
MPVSPDRRVSVSRQLYLSALSDAIDWEDSFLESHWSRWRGGNAMIPHCSPREPCGDAARADALVRRYRKENARLLKR